MDKRDLLLEIGCEEIPARFVQDAIRQLGERMANWLTAHRISYSDIQTFATSRRLTVWVRQVAESQEDVYEEVRGPAERIAKTPDGKWSKAAEGFARKQGVSVEQLELREVKGEVYVFANRHVPGNRTTDELIKGIHEIIAGINFPKTMRWGSDKTRFIRPIRWLVCLFGEEIVPITFAHVRASNISYGHRFLGNKTSIASADQYVDALRQQYVIVDVDERRQLILDQLRQLEEKHNWKIPVDAGLLEEVVFLVEYPTALYGSFSKEFLKLPKEVLITTMREHQRYFPVETKDGELLPYFVTVRNGDDHGIETVAKGNEKVLRARLSDARFFYEEDLKLPIDQAVEKLDRIVFQEDLGTMGDRVRRIHSLALQLGNQLQWDPSRLEKLDRAASICKFDLATQMVGEFSELEGYMGQVYALRHGEDKEVAEAVYEHHLPRSAGDRVPQGSLGTILALADKIDTIVGSFGVGIQPTGSQDPYGLRRRAAGIVQILLQEKWSAVSLTQLIQLALDRLEKEGLLKIEREKVEKEVSQFFALRLKAVMQEQDIRYDVIDAILSADLADLYLAVSKAQVLMEQLERESFKLEVEGFTRTANLAKKAKEVHLHRQELQEPAERDLLQAYDEASEQFNKAREQRDPLMMYQAIAHMVPQIHHFFDHVMVMVEDERVRNNRLALLKEITELVRQYAAFEHIVFAS
ncbi:glycine--tRNA ligase subunit beta [Thermoflavimicrobium dichotomicum]|uniref:Glycine--tRNA ligase beta subunit n=1 Tax=Thermoflavimicrobium dichotomicum TaxID=46223 RepID=A0A1I3NHJ6_9BACL|nr:glycine--tRNA ligase subunit beta [Thermoflavimicrobium dichotomicum]SFJ08635.1 glycyl-tRNA synthetase beta chain [Thermoflavimicrobium dichotomicum]